jgi:uncharacterized membrane protein
VGVAVVADVVTLFGNLLYVVRVFVNPVANQKERAFDVVFVKNFKQAFGLLVAPSGIKGESHLLFACVNAVNRDFMLFAQHLLPMLPLLFLPKLQSAGKNLLKSSCAL